MSEFNFSLYKSIATPKLDLTLPPNNLNEVKLQEMEADPNRSDMDSGHLYGFMILFIDKNSNATQFERINSFYGYGKGFDDISFFGDPNLSYVPTEYFFIVPPRAIQVGEPAATTIQPTMGRTFVKEHQGILMRPLSVSGTTGFRPAIQVSGSLGGIDGRGIPINERTGFFNFIQLRNLFRYYQTLVSNPQYIRAISTKDMTVVMLWVNFHESEFWEFEPHTFVTSRDAGTTTLFHYEISGTLLRRYDSINFGSSDFLKAFCDFIGAVKGAISDIQKYVNLATNYATKYSNMYDTYVQTFASLAYQIVNLGYSLSGTVTGIASIPAELLTRTIEAGRKVGAAFEALYSSSMRTTFSSAGYPGYTRDNIFYRYPTDADYGAYLFNSCVWKATSAVCNLYAFKRTVESSQTNQRNFSYSSNTADFPDFDYDKVARSASSVTRYVVDNVHGGETIYDVAKRTLGNENRFDEIVRLNNLIPPYISNFPTEKGVLTAGDSILVPVTISDLRVKNNMVLPTQPEEFSQTVTNNQLARFLYGVDIKAAFAGYAGTGHPKVDLTIENGDLSRTEGSNNFVQAMALKVNTERGSLKLHPWYGRVFLTGMKASVALVAASSVAFKQCILTDPRVAEVDNVKIVLKGDTLYSKLNVIGQRYVTSIPIVVRDNV